MPTRTDADADEQLSPDGTVPGTLGGRAAR